MGALYNHSEKGRKTVIMSYTPALCVLNLVILVSSTACLYLGSILVNIYLLPYLYLVSSNFATVPYLILGIGGLLLLVSIFGIVFVLELASIFPSEPIQTILNIHSVSTSV